MGTPPPPRFGDRRMQPDQTFQVYRGYPLPPALDYVLDPVGDFERMFRIYGRHVSRMQVAVLPKGRSPVGIFYITLRKPWRTDHNLAALFVICRHRVPGLIPNPEIGEDRGNTRARPGSQLPLHIHVRVRYPDIASGYHRAGFGHAVSYIDIHAPFQGQLSQRLGQSCASYHDLPS